ncbi:MAG TPA: shikimate dehydrogenase (NADP+) [Candidatus Krumholzibacteria bacterium]|nr:shikimate dehydrogenase (NADP+) [Candidatus Krumholzibacteria bacterium]HRX50312.1 shikimate dehydrogenase (NADP+) [Candidatus Krumholzibacteria bacterium]
MADRRPQLLTLAPRAGALLSEGRPWRTKRILFGVVGDPVAHSLSPAFQNAALDAEDFVADYVRLQVRAEELPQFRKAAWGLGLRGFNVTVPHKERMSALCDAWTPEARRLGAVNTVRVRADGWTGHNTDVAGVIAALRPWELLPGFLGVVLGAGGSARAAAAALLDMGAERVVVAAREGASRQAFAAWLRDGGLDGAPVELAPWASLDLPRDRTAAAVACVPEGVSVAPVLRSARGATSFLLDMRYGRQGVGKRPSGWHRQDGLQVLLHQGAAAFGWWFEMTPPLQLMERALAAAL